MEGNYKTQSLESMRGNIGKATLLFRFRNEKKRRNQHSLKVADCMCLVEQVTCQSSSHDTLQFDPEHSAAHRH